MILPILKYPDPVLMQVGEPIAVFDDALRTLVADMFETMYAAQGIGLAAQQIGQTIQLTVIDLSLGKNPEDRMVLVNPEITLKSGKQYEEEGCLSFPEIREKVSRATAVHVRAQNEYGQWKEYDGDKLLARCFQHEIDHLHGILFIDRISALKRDLVKRRIRRLQRDGEW